MEIKGELLSALAERVLKNLEFMDAKAPPWNAGSPEANEPPYADTQLLISLLAILIFPHERTPEALGELLDDYDGPIDEIICIQYSAEPNGRVRLTADNGTSEVIDAKSVKNLPRLLRNSIAHFNIKPLNVDGRFGGIRVWNRTMKGKINFVADLNFDAFRPLARHILSSLRDREKTDLFDPPFNRSKIVHRQIAGSRPWGSAVVVLNNELDIEEIDSVRTRYSSTRFSMLGTYPGATIVARVGIPDVGSITCVSVYGLIDVYAQTTMLRIIADLIPLFDSPEGERVVLGGDMNITTATSPSTPELQRYEAILKAVESLGLRNLAETADERPPQLENCLCGSSSCHHLRTYGDNPGSQLDWLFATPELAKRCRHLRIGSGHVSSLSDHAPVIAKFEIPLGIPTRHWDPDSFVQEVGIRHGAAARRVAEEIIAWAQRKHVQIRAQHPYASLDRLPTSTGPKPELWIQLDLRYPERLGYTVSLTADDAMVTIQFQYMKAPPFDTIEARKRIYDGIAALPGVNIEERLTGRPSFPMSTLAVGDNLERFIKILDAAVDEMVTSHKRSVGSNDRH